MSTLGRAVGRLGLAILTGSLILFALIFLAAIMGPFVLVPIGFAVWCWLDRRAKRRADAARLAALRAQWGLQ